MKIIIDNGGQTCNKFWSYLAPIDYAIRTGEKVYILFPDKDLTDYPYLMSNKYISVFRLKGVAKIVPLGAQERILRRLLSNRLYNIIPWLKNRFHKTIWYSWDDRFITLDERMKKIALDILSPKPEVIDEVQGLFGKKRDSNTIIIGVHIRGGDYRYWQKGKYFFTQQQYRHICDSLKSEFPESKVKFFLSSNELIDQTTFPPNADFFSLPDSNPSKDLYALSQCDYIVGPPSTFSRWAAYSGEKPIRFILSSNNFTASFQKIKSFSHYINGEPIPFSE